MSEHWTAEYRLAQSTRADRWVPAACGHEEPFIHEGIRWLYVWNPATEQHAYLNLDTDVAQEHAPWEDPA